MTIEKKTNYILRWEGEGEGEEANKSSLSFGRTSAGIACCFWAMFDTIRIFRKIKSVFTFIPENPMFLEYKTIFKGNVEKVGNPYVGSFDYV